MLMRNDGVERGAGSTRKVRFLYDSSWMDFSLRQANHSILSTETSFGSDPAVGIKQPFKTPTLSNVNVRDPHSATAGDFRHRAVTAYRSRSALHSCPRKPLALKLRYRTSSEHLPHLSNFRPLLAFQQTRPTATKPKLLHTSL